MLLLALAFTAHAEPYGVPVDGYPSAAERAMLFWTNAARVDPEAFEDDYAAGHQPCGFDRFTDDEQRPKAPLYLDLALTEAARAHSTDMRDNGCFQHESCDGTDTFERIARYYEEPNSILGENIAMGTDVPRYAVTVMWMCSDGHRENIMTGDYDEMGPGIAGTYLTQDFAGGGVLPPGEPPMRVAVHDLGAFYADWADDAAPEKLVFVVEGEERTGVLEYGTPTQGVFRADGADVGGDCHAWFAGWTTADGRSGSFPAEGSFQTGPACTSDWTPDRAGDAFGEFASEPESATGCGCASTPGIPGAGVWAGLAAWVLGRRRRLRHPPVSVT